MNSKSLLKETQRIEKQIIFAAKKAGLGENINAFFSKGQWIVTTEGSEYMADNPDGGKIWEFHKLNTH